MTKTGNIFFGHTGRDGHSAYLVSKKNIVVPVNGKLSGSVNIITGFAEDEQGRIWMANYGDGLFRYSGIAWNNGSNVVTNASGTAVGEGKSNTNPIAFLNQIKPGHVSRYLAAASSLSTAKVLHSV